MRPARRRFRFDVFVSYSHRNKDWVREWLVPRLKSAGLNVCIDHESFEPGAPSITEMERAVLQSRRTVLVLTPEYLQSGWTEFENIMVQTLDPNADRRRLIPIRLAPCDPPLRLGILTQIDFTRADDQDENAEVLITALRRRLPARRRSRVMENGGLPFGIPTGALAPDSPIYIVRRYDDVMRQQIAQAGSTTVVEGARQMGKSSLLARALDQSRSLQNTVIDIDFQELDAQFLHDLGTLLRYLADLLHERLGLAISPAQTWQGFGGHKDKLTSFLHDHVLQGRRLPVVMVMDEVDRVFGQPYQDDFFGLLRAWHNRRARDTLWRRLNLVLAYSTDPRQAIRDPHQSPFNVGVKIQLDDFSFDEVLELNRRYQNPLRRNQLQALVDLIGGHPYLAQQALYALATRSHTLPHLLETTHADYGPFADHLQHHRHRLVTDVELHQGMKQAIINGTCPSYDVFQRLRSLGLLTGVSHQTAAPRCRLYAEYFQRVLS